MKTTKDAILTAIATLKPQLKEMGIDRIALFGSYVNEQQNSYSDIDIAFQRAGIFSIKTPRTTTSILSKSSEACSLRSWSGRSICLTLTAHPILKKRSKKR